MAAVGPLGVWSVTDDPLITCYRCGREAVHYERTDRVDTEFGSRKRVTIGAHFACLDRGAEHAPLSTARP